MMAFFSDNKDIIKTAAAATGALLATALCVARLVRNEYRNIVKDSPIKVDEWTKKDPTILETVQAVAMYYLALKRYNISDSPYGIVTQESRNVAGLMTTRRAPKKDVDTSNAGTKKPPLIVGSMRMGFGHQRIAYGVTSWALDSLNQSDRDVYLHDIVNINSGEADFISEAEDLYSFGSRAMTEAPDFIESKVASATGHGGVNALRIQCLVACLFVSVLAGLDTDSPLISTHPLVGAIAVAAGFRNVVNLVVDNHAQWFVVVPGALNLVQGPRAYQELLKLGVPEDELELAGHWCHKSIVADIPNVTGRRIRRIESERPLRLLIPVGGAGAQKSLLQDIVAACAQLVMAGKLQLFLNAGDHSYMKDAFEKQLEDSGLDFETITTVAELDAFREHLEASEANEPNKSVTLFAYREVYPAVSTTDDLGNVSDVLVCKPSEMAFYSIPKLSIRRVGDHERKSAVRSAELGDGTLEARTVDEIMKNIDTFLNKPRVLINMNKSIRKNHEIGTYDGLKIAVARALERADEMEQQPMLTGKI